LEEIGPRSSVLLLNIEELEYLLIKNTSVTTSKGVVTLVFFIDIIVYKETTYFDISGI
jgi:hypothetical protein